MSMINALIVTYGWVEKFTHGQIVRLPQVAKQTITDWINFCREVCKSVCGFESSDLGGEGKVVAIDEFAQSFPQTV